MAYSFDDRESVEEIQNIYNKEYTINLIKTSKYDLFDLIDTEKKFIIEVKNRNCYLNTYKNTMIGNNKYLKAEEYYNKDYIILFIFKFKDGIFEYQYNKTDKHKIAIGGIGYKGFQNKEYVYIDIDKLKKIN